VATVAEGTVTGTPHRDEVVTRCSSNVEEDSTIISVEENAVDIKRDVEMMPIRGPEGRLLRHDMMGRISSQRRRY